LGDLRFKLASYFTLYALSLECFKLYTLSFKLYALRLEGITLYALCFKLGMHYALRFML
jgi:hypothetical protein